MMTAAHHTPRRWSWRGLWLTLAAAALWGLAPVATKIALEGFSPEGIGVFRLAVATLFCRLLGGPGGRWFVADTWVWVAGVALGMDFILYNYGLQYTAAGVSGLVINVEVVSTIAFAVWLLGERLTPRRVVGCLVTMGGVLLVTIDRSALSDLLSGERTLGNGMVMLAGISWSLFAVAQRRIRSVSNVFHRLAAIFTVAVLTLLPTLLHDGAGFMRGGLRPATMLVVLALLGTGLVYWLYAHAQELLDVSVLAILLSSIPMFAVFFAYVVLGEPLTPRLLSGGVVIVAGILVIAAERGVAPEALPTFAPETALDDAPTS